MTRRRFMTGAASATGAVAAAAITLTALGFAIGPVFDRAPATWQEIGPLSRFNESDYVPVVFAATPGIGEAGNSLAYVRRHDGAIDGPVKDRYDHVVALSSRCVHVGCPVRYVAAARSFVCPCHGGVYDFRGVRVGGPPPRPLDRLDVKIVDAQGKDVWVRGQRLSATNPKPGDRVLVGKAYSIDQNEKPFDLHPPGDPVTGTLSYLFPFTTS